VCADEATTDAPVIVGGGDFFSNLDFWWFVTQGEGLDR
jgi:hypothetical protein